MWQGDLAFQRWVAADEPATRHCGKFQVVNASDEGAIFAALDKI